MNGPHGAGIGICPLIAHHTDAAHRQQHGKALPDLGVQACSLDLADHDLIGFLQNRNSLCRDFAQNANCKPRTRKRLSSENIFRHTKIASDAPYFILEELAQWLAQLPLHRFWQATHVVVALDRLRRPAHARRLDNIRIQRSLHQPIHAARLFGDAARLVIEDRNELSPNLLALRLGIGDTGKLGQEALTRVHGYKIQSQLVAKVLRHLRELILAKYPVVYEDAGELIANSSMNEHGSHGGINASRKRANHM